MTNAAIANSSSRDRDTWPETITVFSRLMQSCWIGCIPRTYRFPQDTFLSLYAVEHGLPSGGSFTWTLYLQEQYLPAPVVSAENVGPDAVAVAWGFPRSGEPMYRLLVCVVNVVGTKFKTGVNSNIRCARARASGHDGRRSMGRTHE